MHQLWACRLAILNCNSAIGWVSSHGLAGRSSFVTSVMKLAYMFASVVFITEHQQSVARELQLPKMDNHNIPDNANSRPMHPLGPLEKVQRDL